MKVSVEEINGKKCTVIRKPFDAEYVREQLAMGITVGVNHVRDGIGIALYNSSEFTRSVLISCRIKSDGYVCTAPVDNDNLDQIVVILPPLPRHPKPEDASLLYRYMSEGIYLVAETGDKEGAGVIEDLHIIQYMQLGYPVEITHALINGERVEIAII